MTSRPPPLIVDAFNGANGALKNRVLAPRFRGAEVACTPGRESFYIKRGTEKREGKLNSTTGGATCHVLRLASRDPLLSLRASDPMFNSHSSVSSLPTSTPRRRRRRSDAKYDARILLRYSQAMIYRRVHFPDTSCNDVVYFSADARLRARYIFNASGGNETLKRRRFFDGSLRQSVSGNFATRDIRDHR